MSADWHFTRHYQGGIVYNPLAGEHFNQGADDPDWKAGSSLVREAIQNSLDAGRDKSGQPLEEEVLVRIDVSPPGTMNPKTAASWFGSLWNHVRAGGCKFVNPPVRPPAGGFIVVEDFGTKGVEGDPAQWKAYDNTDNDFFSFFRAEGFSGKKANAGGSWGVGKSVFTRCSDFHTILALSVRRSDRSIVLMGKSILWHHSLDRNDEFSATGLFGERNPTGGELTMPTSDPEVIKRLKADFKVRRAVGDKDGPPEPGLSIVIPYAAPEVDPRSLVAIVIEEYFYPILRGRLRVVISGEGLPGGSVVLSSDRIITEAAALKKPQLQRLLEVAEWAIQEGHAATFMIRGQPAQEPPRWDKSLFTLNQPAFDDLCDRFHRGEKVSVRVPLRVHSDDRGSQQAHFDVFLQKDEIADGFRSVYVRAGLVVPNVRRHKAGPLFALVDIPPNPLGDMLRAAEPPAHHMWVHTTQNFKDHYEHGKATIDFVVSAPKQIADILAGAASQRDVLALADFFPEPDDEGREGEEGTDTRRKRRPRPPVALKPPKPKPFRIDAVAGGFTIARDNAAATPLPERLEVRIAYDTSRGNPIKKYHPADFDLAKMNPDLEDADAVECAGNVLIVAPRTDGFRIAFDGFDTRRDLLVKVRTPDKRAAADPDGAESSDADDATDPDLEDQP